MYLKRLWYSGNNMFGFHECENMNEYIRKNEHERVYRRPHRRTVCWTDTNRYTRVVKNSFLNSWCRTVNSMKWIFLLVLNFQYYYLNRNLTHMKEKKKNAWPLGILRSGRPLHTNAGLRLLWGMFVRIVFVGGRCSRVSDWELGSFLVCFQVFWVSTR